MNTAAIGKEGYLEITKPFYSHKTNYGLNAWRIFCSSLVWPFHPYICSFVDEYVLHFPPSSLDLDCYNLPTEWFRFVPFRSGRSFFWGWFLFSRVQTNIYMCTYYNWIKLKFFSWYFHLPASHPVQLFIEKETIHKTREFTFDTCCAICCFQVWIVHLLREAIHVTVSSWPCLHYHPMT